jgi:hypothetical protein
MELMRGIRTAIVAGDFQTFARRATERWVEGERRRRSQACAGEGAGADG